MRQLQKENESKSIYIAPIVYYVYLKALEHGSNSFTCKLCLPFLRKRSPDGATPEVADIQLQLTTHLSTQKG